MKKRWTWRTNRRRADATAHRRPGTPIHGRCSLPGEDVAGDLLPRATAAAREALHRALHGRCCVLTEAIADALARRVRLPGPAGLQLDLTGLRARDIRVVQALPAIAWAALRESAECVGGAITSVALSADLCGEQALAAGFRHLPGIAHIAWRTGCEVDAVLVQKLTALGLPEPRTPHSTVQRLRHAATGDDMGALHEQVCALLQHAPQCDTGELQRAMAPVLDTAVAQGRPEVVRTVVRAVLEADGATLDRKRKLALLMARWAPVAVLPAQPGAPAPAPVRTRRLAAPSAPLLGRVCDAVDVKTPLPQWHPDQYTAVFAYVLEILDSPHLGWPDKAAACLSACMKAGARRTSAQLALTRGREWVAAATMHAILACGAPASSKRDLLRRLGVRTARITMVFPWNVVRQHRQFALARQRLISRQAFRLRA